jgi:hypothetical protein
MKKIVKEEAESLDVDSPFTQLFSLLIQNKKFSREGNVSLAFDTQQLEIMHQHTENAIELLLQGLQDLGCVAGMLEDEDKKFLKGLNHIGYYISAIGNLTEALNTLRSDTSYMLQLRKKGT